MRVSMTTLLLLKHAGDKEAEKTCSLASYLLRDRQRYLSNNPITVGVYYTAAGFTAKYNTYIPSANG